MAMTREMCIMNRLSLDHSSRGFSLCLRGSFVSRPVTIQSIPTERVWWGRTSHVLGYTKHGWGQGHSIAPKNTYPRTPLQLPIFSQVISLSMD